MNRITFIISFYLLAISAYGQVTIGSGESAQLGSLLDIKNITGVTDGSENATGGLGLPRVELKNLKPETGTELAESIGGSGDWDMDEHVGLMVYNVNTECNNSGLYAWSGESWNELTKLSDATGGSRRGDSLALVAIYNSTNGDGWTNKTNWLSNKPIDEWTGITMTPTADACGDIRVRTLSFMGNNLAGTLPTEIGNLTELTSLNIPQNYTLTGALPPEIGKLKKLYTLRINNCQFTSLPPEIGELSELVYLEAYNNAFTGSIPKELGKLKNVGTLYLNNNQFDGPIPKEMGDMTKLQTCQLASNRLTGSIPKELSKLENIQMLHLSMNQLTGEIPSELGNIASLGNLYLSNNQLTGSIPYFFRVGEGMALDVSNNQLSGELPAWLSTTYASDLNLSNNKFTGGVSILMNLDPLWELTKINVSGNQLSGHIDQTILDHTKFKPAWVCPQYQEGTTTINPDPFTNYTCP